jgi:hypothetical protein
MASISIGIRAGHPQIPARLVAVLWSSCMTFCWSRQSAFMEHERHRHRLYRLWNCLLDWFKHLKLYFFPENFSLTLPFIFFSRCPFYTIHRHAWKPVVLFQNYLLSWKCNCTFQWCSSNRLRRKRLKKQTTRPGTFLRLCLDLILAHIWNI